MRKKQQKTKVYDRHQSENVLGNLEKGVVTDKWQLLFRMYFISLEKTSISISGEYRNKNWKKI